MNRFTTVLIFEFGSVIRRRMFLIMTAALPILGIGLILIIRLVTAIGGDDEPQLRGYVDQWGRLPAELPAEAPLRPYPSEESARVALLEGEIEAYFVIPHNYVKTGIVREYTTAPSSIFNNREGTGVLRALLIRALVVNELAPEIANRVQLPIVIDTVRLTTEGESAPEERHKFFRFIIPYGFSLLLFMALAFSSGFLVQAVTEEKQTRTIEILLSSVSPPTLMAGKILGLGAAGLLQILVWLIAAWLLTIVAGSILPLPTSITIDPVLLALGAFFFVLAYLFFGTIVTGLGAMATSPQEGSQLAGFVTMVAIIPIIFIAPIIDEPNGTLARVFTLIPFTAPTTVMLRLSAASLPWLDIFGSAIVLSLSSVGALFLSARIFRAYLLLYGRRPGLRELWRTLRTAG